MTRVRSTGRTSRRSLPVMMRETSSTSLISCSCSLAFRSMVSSTAGRRSASISAGAQHLRVAEHGVERRPQLVRERGEELVLQPVGRLGLVPGLGQRASRRARSRRSISTSPSSSEDRLIDEVEERMPRRRRSGRDSRMSAERLRRRTARPRRARGRASSKMPCSASSGSASRDGFAEDVAAADELAVLRVGQVVDVVGAADAPRWPRAHARTGSLSRCAWRCSSGGRLRADASARRRGRAARAPRTA